MPEDEIAIVSARDRKLAALRSTDLESVKEIAKGAYAQIAAAMNAVAPIREDLELATLVLHQALVKEGRERINDPQFDIFIDAPKPRGNVKNDAAIYDSLVSLRIDGDPIPPDVLKDAAWLDTPPPTPPPEPVKKTNLTKVKALVKLYGSPIQEIIDRFVVPANPPPPRFVFKPKEDNVRAGLTDGGAGAENTLHN